MTPTEPALMRDQDEISLIGGSVIVACGLAWVQQPATAPPPAPPAVATPPAPASGFPYAIQQLPQFKGTVARHTLTPPGDVDGLLLGDGTEVHFPPHASTQLVYAVLKAYSMPRSSMRSPSAAMPRDRPWSIADRIVDPAPSPGRISA
jgi:hypothetical protein